MPPQELVQLVAARDDHAGVWLGVVQLAQHFERIERQALRLVDGEQYLVLLQP